MKTRLAAIALFSAGLAAILAGTAAILAACVGTQTAGSTPAPAATVKISRAGGTPISPYAFGNNYFDWVDWNNDGLVGLKGSEEPAKALHLNLLVGDNNQNDANTPQLFDNAEMDKYIQFCKFIGAEPIMIAPVYGNNVDGGPTSAKGAADIVTYINGTKKYGVKYWTIGMEVDIYDQFFKTTKGLPVSTVDEYIAVFNSYAKAMKKANAAAGSGVEIKFVGPELGWRYLPGNDWLTPMLDQCRDYIDVASIHAYGFAAHELNKKAILKDVDRFRWFVKDLKVLVAKHARPGTSLAITEANICYEWDPKSYTKKTRDLGPGTFYAAVWDADRMGAALEADLWTFAFWDLAEPHQMEKSTVFGFILTDPAKNPPTYYKLTPEYYAQWMVTNSFSGTTVIPSGVPVGMSVYACYDAKKTRTSILIINKDTVKRALALAVDNIPARTITFEPMSINIVTIPDDPAADYHLLEYTMKMADAGLPPQAVK
jgi:hypothetical protein